MISVDEIAGLDRTALKALWEEVLGCPPSTYTSDKLMIRVLASEAQWQASGQSIAAIRTRLEKALKSEGEKQHAATGARLIREWNGREYIVDVTRDGYLWKGKTWRSLSAIAREITGTKWSGPRFFGVKA